MANKNQQKAEKSKTTLARVTLTATTDIVWGALVRVPANMRSQKGIHQILKDFDGFVEPDSYTIDTDMWRNAKGEVEFDPDIRADAQPDYELTKDGVILGRDEMPLNPDGKGKLYEVLLMRPAWEVITVRVHAESADKAEDEALSQVGKYGEFVAGWISDSNSQGECQLADPGNCATEVTEV